MQNFTETGQSTGPENIGRERPLPGLLAPGSVLSPSRITLENNEKIRPQPDGENAFVGASGGEGGIRTHGTLAGSTVFETAPFDHSGTSPRFWVVRRGFRGAGVEAQGVLSKKAQVSGKDARCCGSSVWV